MKTTLKFFVAIAAFLITNTVIAQGNRGTNSNQRKTNVSTTTNTSGKTVREGARVNGSINANANASQNAKDHANENSVLNGGTGTSKDKRHTHSSGETHDDHDVIREDKTKSGVKKSKAKKAKKTR